MTTNQTKTYSEEISQGVEAFLALGTPQKIVIDGKDITDAVAANGGIEKWLRRLVVAFSNGIIKAFTITRVDGIVKLYVAIRTEGGGK